MDSACLPPPMLRVTAGVLVLGERAAAGDPEAAARLEEIAALIAREGER